MERSEAKPIEHLLKDLLAEKKLDTHLTEMNVAEAWTEMMGESIAKRTRNIFVKNKVLNVMLNSSVARNELMMRKNNILEKIENKFGKNIINDIKFM